METMLDRLLTQAGACAWGVADGAAVLSVMDGEARARALEQVPGLRRVQKALPRRVLRRGQGGALPLGSHPAAGGAVAPGDHPGAEKRDALGLR